jgi:pimeloyl-ACP methyl ester carboxylesterase
LSNLVDHTAKPGIVLLIHGMYMHGLCMQLLARRLRRIGYQAVLFSYPSLSASIPDNARFLQNFIQSFDTPVVHFVAHSLGGLVVRHLVVEALHLPFGRTVTLGTPHQGSHIAREIHVSRLKFILGRSVTQGLLGDAPPWPANLELGSIAGTLNVGIGRYINTNLVAADGTVAVAETFLQGMTDHICLPVSHTGLLISPTVAVQVAAFLAAGRFRHDTTIHSY